jgi:hypothetical protein
LSLTTKVGPQSRIQASLLEISTTRTCAGSRLRAFSYWSLFTPTVTGSNSEMAVATWTQARCAGLAPRRQLSGRCGHSIQSCSCGSNSPGMRKPSARGVLSMVVLMLSLRRLACAPR